MGARFFGKNYIDSGDSGNYIITFLFAALQTIRDSEQNSYWSYTRPFFPPSKYKKEKAVRAGYETTIVTKQNIAIHDTKSQYYLFISVYGCTCNDYNHNNLN